MKKLRAFLTVYAVALLTLTIGVQRSRHDWSELATLVFPVGAYLLLTFSSWRSESPEHLPGKNFFRMTFWLALIYCIPILLVAVFEQNDATAQWWKIGLAFCTVLGWYLLCTGGAHAVVRRISRGNRGEIGKTAGVFALGALAVGLLIQVGTLFLRITSTNPGLGWSVLLGEGLWITGVYNLGSPLFFGRPVRWVVPLFGPTGRAFYAVCLVSSLGLLLLLALKRLRTAELANSDLFRKLAALQIVFCGFLVTDLLWASEEMSSHPVLATIAAACWAASVVFIVMVGRQIARLGAGGWILKVLIAFLCPTVMEMVIIAPLVLIVDSPGLIPLIAGALLSSVACIALLARAQQAGVDTALAKAVAES